MKFRPANPLSRLLPVMPILLTGCFTVTVWDTYGEWHARLTLPGNESVPKSNSLGLRGGTSYDRVRMCDLSRVSFSLPFTSSSPGRLAAVEVHLARPLCRTGRTPIDGGQVYVYMPVSDRDTLTTAARPDTGWTIRGEIEVTEHHDAGLSGLDVGESRTTETVEGMFKITAARSSGEEIRFEGGAFHMEIIARKYRQSID